MRLVLELLQQIVSVLVLLGHPLELPGDRVRKLVLQLCCIFVYWQLCERLRAQNRHAGRYRRFHKGDASCRLVGGGKARGLEFVKHG